MTTRIALKPQDEAIQLITRLQKLFPALPEPHKGAVIYASLVLNDPSFDTKFCEQVGKVVHITAKFSQKIDREIALRGEKGPLDWHINISPDKSDHQQKTFLFHVLPNQMNETLVFKFVAMGKTANETIRWQKGENCTLDLTRYGHIVNIEVTGITFPDL